MSKLTPDEGEKQDEALEIVSDKRDAWLLSLANRCKAWSLTWTPDGKALFAAAQSTNYLLVRIEDGKTRVLRFLTGWPPSRIQPADLREQCLATRTSETQLQQQLNYTCGKKRNSQLRVYHPFFRGKPAHRRDFTGCQRHSPLLERLSLG
jgi:hypothetical protein